MAPATSSQRLAISERAYLSSAWPGMEASVRSSAASSESPSKAPLARARNDSRKDASVARATSASWKSASMSRPFLLAERKQNGRLRAGSPSRSRSPEDRRSHDQDEQ